METKKLGVSIEHSITQPKEPVIEHQTKTISKQHNHTTSKSINLTPVRLII